MAYPIQRTFTLQGEGMNLEVITESDDIEFLNVILPILNQNYMNSNQIKLVKRDDGIIEIHGLDQSHSPNSTLEIQHDDYEDDSSSAIENQEHVYLEIEATPESLDRDELISKRDTRLERDIHRKRLARARETEEQKVQRLEKDRKRKQEARRHESEEQRAVRLAKDRQRVHQKRQMETDIQRILRLERNRDVKRRSRQRDQTRSKLNISNDNTVNINNNNIGNFVISAHHNMSNNSNTTINGHVISTNTNNANSIIRLSNTTHLTLSGIDCKQEFIL